MTDSQQAQAQQTKEQVITVDGKNYKSSDLSEDAVMLINNIMEVKNLRAVKEVEFKHFGISEEALTQNLKIQLENTPYTNEPEEEA